jgi:hypothetical protein
MAARQYLIDLYLDWRNNWLSIEAFSEHHGLTSRDASELIAMGRQLAYSPHPES